MSNGLPNMMLGWAKLIVVTSTIVVLWYMLLSIVPLEKTTSCFIVSKPDIYRACRAAELSVQSTNASGPTQLMSKAPENDNQR
jgi:hypothetical protein